VCSSDLRMAEIAEEPNSVNCKLRLQRAKWRSELVERRGMRVAEWVDTAQGTEKAAAVLVWRERHGRGEAALCSRTCRTLPTRGNVG
jgi:hypothetical protein